MHWSVSLSSDTVEKKNMKDKIGETVADTAFAVDVGR